MQLSDQELETFSQLWLALTELEPDLEPEFSLGDSRYSNSILTILSEPKVSEVVLVRMANLYGKLRRARLDVIFIGTYIGSYFSCQKLTETVQDCCKAVEAGYQVFTWYGKDSEMLVIGVKEADHVQDASSRH